MDSNTPGFSKATPRHGRIAQLPRAIFLRSRQCKNANRRDGYAVMLVRSCVRDSCTWPQAALRLEAEVTSSLVATAATRSDCCYLVTQAVAYTSRGLTTTCREEKPGPEAHRGTVCRIVWTNHQTSIELLMKAWLGRLPSVGGGANSTAQLGHSRSLRDNRYLGSGWRPTGTSLRAGSYGLKMSYSRHHCYRYLHGRFSTLHPISLKSKRQP